MNFFRVIDGDESFEWHEPFCESVLYTFRRRNVEEGKTAKQFTLKSNFWGKCNKTIRYWFYLYRSTPWYVFCE